MLTTDQIKKLTLDTIFGKPLRVVGKEADEFVAKLKVDLEFAKQNGWTIELPFDMED